MDDKPFELSLEVGADTWENMLDALQSRINELRARAPGAFEDMGVGLDESESVIHYNYKVSVKHAEAIRA